MLKYFDSDLLIKSNIFYDLKYALVLLIFRSDTLDPLFIPYGEVEWFQSLIGINKNVFIDYFTVSFNCI